LNSDIKEESEISLQDEPAVNFDTIPLITENPAAEAARMRSLSREYLSKISPRYFMNQMGYKEFVKAMESKEEQDKDFNDKIRQSYMTLQEKQAALQQGLIGELTNNNLFYDQDMDQLQQIIFADNFENKFKK
jgi:hypothetical protein